jgi:hypothetical protein
MVWGKCRVSNKALICPEIQARGITNMPCNLQECPWKLIKKFLVTVDKLETNIEIQNEGCEMI